jgi:predicted small integral membrane protein
MVGSLALLAGLVTFDNLIDYENEFGEQRLVDIASDPTECTCGVSSSG